jgi:hypothetical protein
MVTIMPGVAGVIQATMVTRIGGVAGVIQAKMAIITPKVIGD